MLRTTVEKARRAGVEIEEFTRDGERMIRYRVYDAMRDKTEWCECRRPPD